MKAIYTLWTKPCSRSSVCGYSNRRIFTQAARLSVRLARRQFGRVELVTDTEGREFVRQCGIKFDAVHTSLDRLADIHPKLWCYGKMEAYRLQTEPFMHLDFDVFIKRPLPLRRLFADKALVFQGWEPAPTVSGNYARAIRACEVLDCPAPPPWKHRGRAVVAGVVAGLELDYVQRWCDLAADWVENPRNRAFWERALRGGGFKFCVAMEQYLPHEITPTSKIGVLLETATSARELGFVHYAGTSKRDPQVEAKIRKHYRTLHDYTSEVVGPIFGDLDI
ncbi:MAG: hypothetical protein HKN82_04965 [Akkermansiaceae bacterium]|nr:hypothetical protein [Akkermansiaceae bacterium]NNM28983.1 hypothetical protein [Akkermansiaceae bacterium]